MSLKISIFLFQQSQTKLEVIYIFTKINYQTNEKPDKTASKAYFRKLLNERPLFNVNLSSLDNLVHFLGHIAINNPFVHSIMFNWSVNISSEHFFSGCEYCRSRTKQKLKNKVVWRTGTDVQNPEEDWNRRTKLPSMSGHLRFTFWPHPGKCARVSIPDMEIESTTANLYNVPGLLVLLKKCPKNDGIIRGLSAHENNRWHRIFYWITTGTKTRLGKDYSRYVFATYFLLCKTFNFPRFKVQIAVYYQNYSLVNHLTLFGIFFQTKTTNLRFIFLTFCTEPSLKSQCLHFLFHHLLECFISSSE